MKNFLFVCSFLLVLGGAVKAQDASDEENFATEDSFVESGTAQNPEVDEAADNDASAEEAPAVGIALDDDYEDDSSDNGISLFDDDYDENTKVNPNKSLTENLTQKTKSDKKKKDGNKKSASSQNNWMDKLISSNSRKKGENKKEKESSSSLLEDMMEENKTALGNSRSNASVFDISGVMLRMNLAQADEALQKRGYKKISQKLEIPNFIKWRNEELCRGAGVVGYERLGNCVKQKAQKDHYEYVETAQYSKFDTKESMEIHLTSTFTGNKIYKVIYKSESTFVRGSSQKAAYLRNIKIFDFWKRINQKYGAPDNKDDVLWGLGGNKPYMHAKTGYLVLEDPLLRELDYTRMSREDQRFINTDVYTF